MKGLRAKELAQALNNYPEHKNSEVIVVIGKKKYKINCVDPYRYKTKIVVCLAD